MLSIAKHVVEETDTNSRRKTEALRSYAQLMQAKCKIVEGIAKSIDKMIELTNNRIAPAPNLIEEYLDYLPEGNLIGSEIL